MDKPSKTFSKAGFYLILVFTFFAPFSPVIAQFAAVLAFGLWIIEQLIFRNTDWIQEEMFLPIAGFIGFTLLSYFIARLGASETSIHYTGYLAIFYFVVQRFVSFSEKRKMIIWSFIAGAFISSAVGVIMRFSGPTGITFIDSGSQKISYYILIVFAMLLGFYSESKILKEKLFYGLITMPLVIFAIISFDIHVILILLLLLAFIGIFKDHSAFLPFLFYSILIFSGFLVIDPVFSVSEAGNILKSTVVNFGDNLIAAKNISFFGLTDAVNIARIESRTDSFFLRLLITSGPPALLLFSWILTRQLKGDLVKIRKTTYIEMKSFHLGIALTIAAFIMLSLFGSIFHSSSAILVFWMILGMSEA